MANVSYELVMAELKKALKRQNTSYAELARQMDLPESTLKKWLNAEDGSFNRINMICQAMGLSVFGVIKNAEEQNVQTFTFNEAQQQHFMKDKESFVVYWLLVYERLSVDAVIQKLALDKDEINKILLRLDRLGLVQFGAENVLRVPKMRPIRWKFEGAFMTELLRDWVTKLFKDNLLNKKGSALMLQFFQLTPQSEDEFRREIAQLEEKYARRTILELNNPSQKLKQIRYISALAEGSFVDE
ncbi:helix-turn-helix domain-containing protein [Peredibacter sp. HCB2-198]|uniref:helix-turn-helix domain-containing protein n=1 Tax=Peredibacter sp. HCB2-198 TaxID=3383025 RepID=UPI0038B677A9